ncbi:hypothetical protein SH661x_000982 [Planctomicrobium sp. SH661]|uniref:hypothetical protein n=1 Tax=Planctomicrobium sp. SH661 TaxID=3448124 RepID=UPI003F5C031F
MITCQSRFSNLLSFSRTMVAAIASTMLGLGLQVSAAESETAQIVVASNAAAPVQHAVSALKAALEEKGIQVHVESDLCDPPSLAFLVGIPGEAPWVDRALSEQLLSVPEAPESLLISRIERDIQDRFLVAGRDPRGTAYALYEIAEAIRTAPSGTAIADAVRERRESPFLAVRSVTQQLFNQDLEREWYESEEYWHWYFGMLARNRFNNYSMTLGHNTNYMIPPSAYMLEVPGFETVQVTGHSAEDRQQSLQRFRRITEIADEYGIDFTLGLWTQLPVVAVREGMDFGESPVVNLPEGPGRSEYCGRGLQKLLEACPAIDGVQMRMNLESGIPHEQQEEFYKTVFQGIAACGRPVKVDLRYKSLSQKTIDLARAAGLDVTVSTKHWCEHLGLPYHPTWQDPAYSASRYGFGTMLKHDRNYRVTYRLWNVGSSRLLLWGDPDYASRFAQSCTLGGGEGFEVFAPLSYRGYGNQPGNWRILADRSKEDYRWEQQRYWAFYLAFGRFGYHPETPRDVWSREFQHRFGEAGQDLSFAMRNMSQVIPLVTATTQFSANSWRFWPEMMTCMPIDAYRAIPPSDYSQFYAIAPYSTRQQWRSEDWAASHSSYVEDAINGNLNSKWTPFQVANELTALADKSDRSIASVEAIPVTDSAASLERQATIIDLKALALLARYHAAKKRAATHLEFFRVTKDPVRLKLAWKQILQAQQHWQQLSEITSGHYADNMNFGHSQEHHCDYLAKLQIHTGHWKDRLVEVQADVDAVARLLDQHQITERFPTEEELRGMKRYPGEVPAPVSISFSHDRIESVVPGQNVSVSARVNSDRPLKVVSVYYRPLNQTATWKRLTMTDEAGTGTYRAQINASEIDPQFDLQYYLEARHATGGEFWPHWQNETPYIVVPVRSR